MRKLTSNDVEQLLKYASENNPVLKYSGGKFPYPKQQELLKCTQDEILWGGAAGGSKGLPLDTPIPGPNGWKHIVDLVPGDYVFDEYGKPTKVILRSEIHNIPCYVVEFDNAQEMVCDKDHLWVTLNYNERAKNNKRTPEYRAKRRSTRPKRGGGTKRGKILAERNTRKAKENEHKLLDPIPQQVRSVQQIKDTIWHSSKLNHSIRINNVLEYPAKNLELDPYLLGCWLGDGCSTGWGFCTNDDFIIREFKKHFKIIKWRAPYMYGVYGLSTFLGKIGVQNNKHIPDKYLHASKEQRIALLQGLMDTDGCAAQNGKCSFCNTNKRIIDGIVELARSLGCNVNTTEFTAKLNGKPISKAWNVYISSSSIDLFRLPRKLSRQRKLTKYGKNILIKDVRECKSVPTVCIATEAGTYLAGRYMIPTHNTTGLWFKALQHVDNPNYHCLIVRRTYQDLALPGSLIDIAKESLKGTDAVYNGSLHQCQFPSGAVINFGYLDSIGDCYRYKSAEFSTFIADEASEIEESNLRYMHSRLRTVKNSGLKTQYILATNPGGPSHQYIYDRYINPVSKVKNSVFIKALYQDNKSLNAEEYKANLAKLTEIEYRQLALGEWILDDSRLIYHFDPKKNLLIRGRMIPEIHQTVMGIDLGYNDDSAITVLGWNHHHPELYCLFSEAYHKTDAISVINIVLEQYEKHNPDHVVIDTAGTGKMIAEAIRRRWPKVPIKAANKQDKFDFIRLLNADFEHSLVKIRGECTDLTKELNNLDKDKHGKENPNKPNHCTDSLLYAYKEARNYWAQEIKPQENPEEKWLKQLRTPIQQETLDHLL